MTAHTIWTIGYEQATVAGVMASLRSAGVEVLADVRALPLSRRPGFSKTALAANAREAGIDYVHFKALGTPAEGRAAARRNDHATLERIYAGQLELPEAIASGARLADLATERRVALLCYEREAHGCHRTLLRQAVLPEFEVVDLLPEET
ncbi:DUF488 domain-containing protein [Novosphingobium sp. MMS21-SN21R]|uniref:DUF488 domain-containing protein n=1 Tax=Novosphingobium sp. MMS21-SN21R TaxID=2969298 RepID=UPI002883C95C|nr:DUF488 domain-containing protein [Novosphingobium sp. MMS21-SN21R]MDT0508120.1 DUF488 domain-containing protein [Novosphingobium sp. MMS21-SN21R]